MVPFTASMLVGSLTHILMLSLSHTPTHKHMHKVINKYKQASTLLKAIS